MHNPSCGKRCEWPFAVLQFTQGSGIASSWVCVMARLRVLRQLDMFLVLWRHRSGSAMIEYSLIVAIVTGMVLAIVALLGSWVASMFSMFSP